MILIEKEIDDDHIIVVRENGEKLLLEKWSLRFSPLVFEGKRFVADVSPMWVTIYFENRSPIKWSIEEDLGRAVPRKAASPAQAPLSSERIILFHAALLLLDYDPRQLAGPAGPKTEAAIRAFQRERGLPVDGKPSRATAIALSAEISRRFPNQPRALDIATALLATASAESEWSAATPSSAVIESQIRGDFEGWDGDTVFILDNGQIWQQSSYAYTYHYAFRPKVFIFSTRGGYKMIVEGLSESVYVKRIK